MQVCRHCGWENPEIAAFCTNCGTGLGRGRTTGPRFRALGLTGEVEEVKTGSVDAAWPTIAGPGGPLNRTLVDIPAPDGEALGEGDGERGALVPAPAMRNAPLARRTTGPVLLPDEAASSVDIGPARTEELGPVRMSDPPQDPLPDPEAVTEDFDAPVDDVAGSTPLDEDDPPEPGLDAGPGGDASDADEGDPDEPAPSEPPVDEAYEEQNTEPHPVVVEGGGSSAAADSLEEDGFDEFMDPSQPDGDDGDDPDASGELEIAAPEDSLGSAIDDFARDADVRIEPPSDGPRGSESLEEYEDELELSTSDLHTVDLSVDGDEEPDSLDPGATHPAMRAVPPPLPAVSLRYVLRPFSQRDGHHQLVPIGDGPVVIGRKEGDVRVGDDDYVSPRHARFGVVESTLFVDDLDSLNGVWLRVRVDVRLSTGDEMLIGQQWLRVEEVPQRVNGVSPRDGTRRLGMALGGSRFRIAQLADDGQPLDLYHLPDDGCRIGRRLGDIVFTDDTFMSGTHALLVPEDGEVVLRDLSSRNGCWVRVRGRAALDTGDAVMIGRTVWRVGRPVG